MKVKTSNIRAHLIKHGTVSVKLDRACGLTHAVITKRNDGYVVGRTPGSQREKFNESEVINFLDGVAMYVISWS